MKVFFFQIVNYLVCVQYPQGSANFISFFSILFSLLSFILKEEWHAAKGHEVHTLAGEPSGTLLI